MTQEIYPIALFILATLITLLGALLVVGSVPKRLQGSVYQSSRRLMGAALLLLAIILYIFISVDMIDLPHKLRMALDISGSYIVAKLMGYALLILLGKTDNQRSIWYNWCLMSAFILPPLVWLTLITKDPQLLTTLLTIESVAFSLLILLDLLFILRCCRATRREGKCNIKGVLVNVRNVEIASCYMLFIGITFPIMALVAERVPYWGLILFLSYILLVSILIFERYTTFTSVCANIIEAEADIAYRKALKEEAEAEALEADSHRQLSSEMNQHIKRYIVKWLREKEYCKPHVSILSASLYMGTNRLYLSIYINREYQCSFKVWVSKLRVAEAKVLMTKNRDMTITEIALKVGFSSLTSLLHAFKAFEGITPKVWAAQQYAKTPTSTAPNRAPNRPTNKPPKR